MVAAFFVWLQNFCYRRLWKKGFSYNVRFSVKEAFEGDRIYLTEEISNKKLLPLPWIHVKTVIPNALTMLENNEPISKKGAGSSLYSIGKYTAVRKRHFLLCNERGVYNLRYTRITAADLLHTSHYGTEIRTKGELLVFPRFVENFRDTEILKHLDAAILSNQLINPDPFEFKGIRDYLPTDTLKSVNFRASAISQKLMVNIHAPTAAKRITLVLNLDSISPRELSEQSIRLTATLARHFIEQGAQLSFRTNGRDAATGNITELGSGTSTSHLYKIFECLARLSLSFKYSPTEIASITDREHLYVFISPDTEIIPAFKRLRENGTDAFLITPFFKENIPTVQGEGISLWNASEGRNQNAR
jgi:hypothetical protein